MKKTLMLAATILSLGAGAALAADGANNRVPAHMNDQPSSATTTQHRLFSASNVPQTSVYGMFRGPGYPQGGEQ